jgi:hypothetical protein
MLVKNTMVVNLTASRRDKIAVECFLIAVG